MSSPLIFAHRGSWGAVAQNSIEAILIANSLGADGCEIDVRMTSDGEMILCHDRVFEGREISESTLSELQGSLIGFPALLRDALVAGSGVGMNLEIKPVPPSRVHDLVENCLSVIGSIHPKTPACSRLFVSSFESAILEEFARQAPSLGRSLLVAKSAPVLEVAQLAVNGGHFSVGIHWSRATPRMIKSLHRLGLAVGVWTVDNRIFSKYLSYYPVSMIITNRVDRLRSNT